MNASTCLIIKVHNYRIWWRANIDESLQCDHMELLCHPKNPSNLGSSHWGHIDVVVEDIHSFKINTPLNQFNKRGRELKPWGKHAPKVGSLTRKVTQPTRVYKKKAKFRSILTLNESKMQRHIWIKWDLWSLRRWILTTHLGAWIYNNPLHANLQLVGFQDGTKFLQHAWVINIHDNDDPFIR